MKKDLIDTIHDQKLKMALTMLRTEKRGRPKKKEGVTSCPDGYVKVCFNIPVEMMAKVREIAYLETRMIKTIVEDGLNRVIQEYEAEHGTVVPMPEHVVNVRKR